MLYLTRGICPLRATPADPRSNFENIVLFFFWVFFVILPNYGMILSGTTTVFYNRVAVRFICTYLMHLLFFLNVQNLAVVFERDWNSGP